jgi:hypothetical protein
LRVDLRGSRVGGTRFSGGGRAAKQKSTTEAGTEPGVLDPLRGAEGCNASAPLLQCGCEMGEGKGGCACGKQRRRRCVWGCARPAYVCRGRRRGGAGRSGQGGVARCLCRGFSDFFLILLFFSIFKSSITIVAIFKSRAPSRTAYASDYSRPSDAISLIPNEPLHVDTSCRVRSPRVGKNATSTLDLSRPADRIRRLSCRAGTTGY